MNPVEIPPEAQERLLTASEVRVFRGPTFSAEGEAQCDGNGNVYFHVGNGTSYMDPTIFKLGHGEDEHQLYKLPGDVTNHASIRFGAFSLTPSGQLWVLTVKIVEDRSQVWAFRYTEDGTIASQVHFETPNTFNPRQFAAFENGIFFVEGEISERAGGKPSKRSYAATVHESGRIVHEMALDLSSLKRQEGMMAEGHATAGSDGNLYFLLPEQVLVISQSGNVVRRIAFAKPRREAVATRLDVSGGDIAIWLEIPRTRGPFDIRLLVLDSNTGDQIGLYRPADELGNNAVCFSRAEGFTFMRFIKGSSAGAVEFLTAGLR